MKGKLLFILALPAIAYLGVKLYLHMQVAKTMDMVVQQVSPFADVSYGSCFRHCRTSS